MLKTSYLRLIIERFLHFGKVRRHNLRLDCGVDNKALCQYYSNFGFKQTGTKVVNGSKEALFEKDIR